MFNCLRGKIFYSFTDIFLHPKVKRPSPIIYILSKFENSENRYTEVTSLMSGYQAQSRAARFTIKYNIM